MEIRRKLDSKQLEYNFYYYTNNAEFRLNVKTLIIYGLAICSLLIVMSVDYFFNNKMYLELTTTTALFIGILFIIRRLNK